MVINTTRTRKGGNAVQQRKLASELEDPHTEKPWNPPISVNPFLLACVPEFPPDTGRFPDDVMNEDSVTGKVIGLLILQAFSGYCASYVHPELDCAIISGSLMLLIATSIRSGPAVLEIRHPDIFMLRAMLASIILGMGLGELLHFAFHRVITHPTFWTTSLELLIFGMTVMISYTLDGMHLHTYWKSTRKDDEWRVAFALTFSPWAGILNTTWLVVQVIRSFRKYRDRNSNDNGDDVNV